MGLDGTPYLIDANVCIGIVNESDALHSNAKNVLTKLKKRGHTFVLLDHVIQEALTVLLYSSRYKAIDPFTQELFTDPNVFAVDTPIDWLFDALDMAKRYNFNPKMSLTDWLLLSRSKATGAPILTFDKQLIVAHKNLS
jgi:predicted nucleic acid-binding protein